MKKLLAVFLAAVMMLSLAACGSSSSASSETAEATSEEVTTEETATEEKATEEEATEETSSDGGYVIGFSNFSMGDSWRVQMEGEFKSHAEKLKAEGVISDYIMLQANEDQAKQISDIQDLITMGVDAIVVTCITPEGVNSAIEEARDAGIVVVNFNQSCTAEVDSRLTVSDYDLLFDAGKWLGEQIPEGGKVIQLDGIEGNAINQARHDGGEAGLKESNPTAEIVTDQYLAWDYATAKAAMEDIINSYEIDGVLSQGGAMTQAAIDAFNEAGLDLVPMVGEAGNGFLRVWLENVDNGLDAVAFSNPAFISAMALDTAIDILNGEEVDAEINVFEDAVTIDTAADLYRSDVNDSFWVHTWMSDEEVKELFPAEG